MDNNDWRNNPSLQGISPEKLALLTELMNQSAGKSPNELIPFFLAAANKAEASGSSFTDNETDLILEVLKADMSPEQRSRIDTIKKLSKMIYAKRKK